MTSLRISQLADRSGVPATTPRFCELRFHESAGLLPAGRTASGYRVYGERAVDRLAFIGSAKHLGLPLEEIAELLAVWGSGSCSQVRADLRPRVADRMAEARGRIAELEAFTASLRRALERLDALPDHADRCDAACGFLTPAASTRGDDGERWRSAPVARSLPSQGAAERGAQWRRVLDGAVREPVPDGVRLTLPVERAGAVAALAASEQECCPFFDFRLHLDGPRLRLEVRAPAEGAALLAELFTGGSPGSR
jgi:MerR family transcriptional regulator, copper efflux regulator